MGVPNSWIVYDGKCNEIGSFGGASSLGNLHICNIISKYNMGKTMP